MATLPRPEALGYAIRQVRTARGLSQEDAALASGIDRAYFGHIERATKNPTMQTVWKVADALDVPASDLLRQAEALAKRKD
jgi:transcriptional regulator with XRE-family HTH domain